MAKAKKTKKSKSILHKKVDNKLSLVLIVLALIIFVLAAVSMGK